MSEFGSRWMREGRTPLSSAPAKDIARCEAATTEGSGRRLKRSCRLSLLSGNCCFTALSPVVPFRQRQVALSQKQVTLFQRVLRLCEAGCSYPSVRAATAGPPPSGAPLPHAGGPMAPGTNQVPWASSSLLDGSSGQKDPRPEPPTFTFHKLLRLCPAGHCYPPRLDRINRDLPHGSALGSKQEPSGSWQYGGTPPGFLGKGVVLTPASVVHPIEMNRSST